MAVLGQPVLAAFVEALSDELARIGLRVQDYFTEIDPRSTNELFEEWKKLVGLPDECTPADITPTELRNQVVQKFTNIGGLTVSFYEAEISKLGTVITVNDLQPFLAGSRAGDALYNPWDRNFKAGSTAGSALRDEGWQFFFKVDLPLTSIEIFEAGDPCGQPLQLQKNELVECTMQKLKPAHTSIWFVFS